VKPTTAAEAIAFSQHRRLHPTHDGFGCCHFWEIELADAAELVSDLEAIGWDPPRPSLSLPTSVPSGEPKSAAKEIDNLSDRQWAVWWLLSFYRRLTDEELVERYGLHSGARAANKGGCRILPPQTPQSIRSRRAELVRAGHVVKTAERRPTSNGGTAAVWAAVGSATEALAS
jgi:hypothetical protein